MATFIAIRNKKQTTGALKAVLEYVLREKKIAQDGVLYASTHNCVLRSVYAEMLTTKERFHKTDGRQFYHFVQSFSEEDGLTPQEVNALGLELARREFPEYEVVVATHVDTGHLHNHIVVNSVNCQNGKKLHQHTEDLLAHRQANDDICLAYGLNVLPPVREKKRRMKPGEYQAGLRGKSWKLDLVNAINEALEYADDRESFIENMEQEGYKVIWTNTRKYITFITPEGRRCRDASLHDETFLKSNLEMLFAYRQATGFEPSTPEPEMGWLGELVFDAVRLGKYLEQAGFIPQEHPLPVWTESKQRQRETLKKLAHGQKLSESESMAWDDFEL